LQEAHTLVEANYFKDVTIPFKSASGHDSSGPGYLVARDNIFDNCGATRETNGTVPEASTYYTYSLDAAADVPTIVVAGAGVGKISTSADSDPPTPNPMTWATAPHATGPSSIAMIATTASDPSGVEYYFANVTDPTHDSGWRSSPSFTDTGLAPATSYTYTVKARDMNLAQNTTAPSVEQSATTGTPDATPPTPDPMTWATVPHATGISSIAMTATTASDPSGVEYSFTNLTVSGHDSGWQDSPSYTDTGLTPGTSYSYTVKARDKSTVHNETTASAALSATTDPPPTLPSPVAHWKLDEICGATAHDGGGLDLSGTLVNMTNASWVAGRYGHALQFDGVDDRVTVPHNAALNFGAGPFTISFWLKQSYTGAEQVYLIKGTYGGTSGGTGKRYEIYYKDSTFRFAIDDNSTKTELDVTSGDFITGDWVFVTAVRDTAADVIRLYANGQSKGSAADGTGDISQTEGLVFGSQPAGTAPLNGTLDDIRIYGVALTQDQVATLYLSHPVIDVTAVAPDSWLLY
jgi:chitodextrinase